MQTRVFFTFLVVNITHNMSENCKTITFVKSFGPVVQLDRTSDSGSES